MENTRILKDEDRRPHGQKKWYITVGEYEVSSPSFWQAVGAALWLLIVRPKDHNKNK